jgi:outer membrane protein TolC
MKGLLFVVVPLLVVSAPLVAAGQADVASQRSPFQGSVPRGTATTLPLTLSLKDAIDRALTTNLGAVESAEGVRSSRAQWLRSLSSLLPNATAKISTTTEQVSLASLGFNGLPGLALPSVIGPFSYTDARIYVSQSVFNWADINHMRSASALRQAAESSYQAARELVVQAAANAYLVAIADAALVDATRAQVETATASLKQTTDQNRAGVVASIDVLRARVQLQTEQQQLIAADNQLAIDKLNLARVIGLPNGQQFALGDSVPYSELTEVAEDEALRRAYTSRPDYQSAQAQVRAAELARRAAAAGNYPSVSVAVNYGAIGTTFASSQGTTSFVGSVAIPIFQGTSVRADVLQADAVLERVRAELEDLGGQIDYQVRTAFLNLASANQLVAVGRSSVDLASQTLLQARDRLAAGVTNNLEVVEAQQAIAQATQSYIASVYRYNSAKVALARAVGAAEHSALSYLGVK